MTLGLSPEKVPGIDYHVDFQYLIDLQKLWDMGFRWIIGKKGEHLNFDRTERNNVVLAKAKEIGFLTTDYHFHRITNIWEKNDPRILSIHAQGEKYLKNRLEHALPMVVDGEDVDSIVMGRVTGRQMGTHLLDFLYYLKRYGDGRPPMLYTADWVMKHIPVDLHADFAEFLLWVASYLTEKYTNSKGEVLRRQVLSWDHKPVMPKSTYGEFSSKSAWPKPHLFQCSSIWQDPAVLKGYRNWITKRMTSFNPPRLVNVDVNWATQENLNELMGIEPTPPPTPEPDPPAEEGVLYLNGYQDGWLQRGQKDKEAIGENDG